MKGSKNLGYLLFVVFWDCKKYCPIFGFLLFALTMNPMGHKKAKNYCMSMQVEVLYKKIVKGKHA